MATFSHALHWSQQFTALRLVFRDNFPENDRYMDSAGISDVNPLANAFPLNFEDFFGPKILNILIIGEPYGWENDGGMWSFNWPPDGFDIALAAIRDKYQQWSNYTLYMYADQWLVNQVKVADPSSRFPDMIKQTFDKLKDICSDNKDIGFIWKGDIPDDADYTFFIPAMTDYYENT